MNVEYTDGQMEVNDVSINIINTLRKAYILYAANYTFLT